MVELLGVRKKTKTKKQHILIKSSTKVNLPSNRLQRWQADQRDRVQVLSDQVPGDSDEFFETDVVGNIGADLEVAEDGGAVGGFGLVVQSLATTDWRGG